MTAGTTTFRRLLRSAPRATAIGCLRPKADVPCEEIRPPLRAILS